MNIQNVLLWFECRHEDAPLVNAIVNNTLFHSNSHQSDAALSCYFLVDSLLQIL